MGYFGKKDSGYPKEFTKWVGSNYGPPGRISKDDLKQLYDEWQKKNNLNSGASVNALAG